MHCGKTAASKLEPMTGTTGKSKHDLYTIGEFKRCAYSSTAIDGLATMPLRNLPTLRDTNANGEVQ